MLALQVHAESSVLLDNSRITGVCSLWPTHTVPTLDPQQAAWHSTGLGQPRGLLTPKAELSRVLAGQGDCVSAGRSEVHPQVQAAPWPLRGSTAPWAGRTLLQIPTRLA